MESYQELNPDAILTAITEPKNISSPHDCVVINGDEYDPEDIENLLTASARLLLPTGILVACFSNRWHWKNLFRDYISRSKDQSAVSKSKDPGITVSELDAVKTKLGELDLHLYDICDAGPPNQSLANLVKEFSKDFDVDHGSHPSTYQTLNTSHFILRSGVKRSRHLEITGLCMTPEAGMNEVRILLPFRSVSSIQGVSAQAYHGSMRLTAPRAGEAKIMIWQRQALTYNESIETIKTILRAGYLLINEFDDDPSHFPVIPANNYLSFRGVDAVQVSTQPLMDQLEQYNPHIHVFSNCVERLPRQTTDWPDKASPDTPIRLFFGALNRAKDWHPCMPALNSVLEASPDAWHVEVVHDRAFFDALKTTRKNFTPLCDYTTYRNVMSGCHIAFMPLRDTNFNKKKSDLKFVEAASHGLATLASGSVYSASITHNSTGAIFKSNNDLIEILKTWQARPSIAQQLGRNARDWVRSNRLQKNQANARINWYLKLWDMRESIRANLYDRVPELRA